MGVKSNEHLHLMATYLTHHDILFKTVAFYDLGKEETPLKRTIILQTRAQMPS